MELLTATVGGYVAIGVLCFSGLSHALDIETFASIIQAQTPLHRPWSWAAAICVSIVELGLGAACVVLLVVHESRALTATMGAMAMLYAFYSVYSLLALERRPGAPCGCSRDDIPNSVWVVIRAIVLAGAAFAGTRAPIAWVSANTESVVTAVAAAALGVLVWNFPGALHRPRLYEVEAG